MDDLEFVVSNQMEDCVLVFIILPTAKVIWRQGHSWTLCTLMDSSFWFDTFTIYNGWSFIVSNQIEKRVLVLFYQQLT